ncbi:GUN4 domain-containing protein [Leptolyngbya sp. CCNP1308]|uniref:GUN4 domain-containing protein n=1 Tax=Leptolyngbya sp. CCNP1308 TaxID=3110255 RepID=UPI002B202B34|nr:GUN4 domain-containing protein [Leptolyngbya sp. CCNP1308]MEA5451233.1 GUN4 domain-containing protein [Leptolyngbya sp. CCNP1308]
MAQTITFLIKIVETDLKSDEVVTEVRYLIDDLLDLDGMGQTRFEKVPEVRDVAEISVGVQFDAESDLLGSILRRLRDRLYYNPIETYIRLRLADINLQVQTHQADDLTGLMAVAQSGVLFSPECDYLIEAETYSRSQGELSPTELDNLNLLRQRLGLSVELAEVLNARAAGPYRTRAEKCRHFEEITSAEFSRLRTLGEGPPFAPKALWPVLQELAENLGLPTPEAEAIYQKHQQSYDDDIKLKTNQNAAKTAEDARLAAEAKAEGDRQKQAQQAREHLEQYLALCRQTMASSLYPSEFDQGRLDQARRLRDISTNEALALEATVRNELYGSIESAAGVDYSRLRDLLHQQAWQEADMETEAVLLKALDRDMQPITATTVQRIPAVDLATIDALWSRYSNKRFGFKAQQQVHRAQQQVQQDDRQQWLAFQQALGWREPPSLFYQGYRPYHDLNFNLEAPLGHLPTWRWCCPSLSDRYRLSLDVMAAVIHHLNECMPLTAAATPAVDPAAPTVIAGGPTRAV